MHAQKDNSLSVGGSGRRGGGVCVFFLPTGTQDEMEVGMEGGMEV